MKKLLFFFVFLTAINAAVFLLRDRFQYVKYATYEDLYSPCNEACLSKWSFFKDAYTKKDWTEAREILAPLRLDTGSTLSKAMRLGRHLYGRFYRQAGYPQDTIHRASPLQAYNILSNDTAQKVFCGTYALMYNFFCWAAGISCRNVEIFRPGDHHVLNEIYLPEQKQWVMVDLTSNLLGVLQEGRLLNVRNLAEGLQKSEPLQILRAGDSTAVSMNVFTGKETLLHYYNPAFPYLYYHAVQATEIYRPGEKFKRYFLPESWYEVYAEKPKANPLFFLRLFLAACWLILAGTIVYKLFRK